MGHSLSCCRPSRSHFEEHGVTLPQSQNGYPSGVMVDLDHMDEGQSGPTCVSVPSLDKAEACRGLILDADRLCAILAHPELHEVGLDDGDFWVAHVCHYSLCTNDPEALRASLKGLNLWQLTMRQRAHTKMRRAKAWPFGM